MDISYLTKLIKDECLSVGFSKVGIAEVKYYPEDKSNLENWLNKNRNASMNWMKNNQRNELIFLTITLNLNLLFLCIKLF